MDTYRIYDGTDENGIVGTVAPGLFAQEGRCWRMVYAEPATGSSWNIPATRTPLFVFPSKRVAVMNRRRRHEMKCP